MRACVRTTRFTSSAIRSGFMTALTVVAVAHASLVAAETPRETAQLIFKRLTGTAIHLDDPRLAQMEQLITSGKKLEAALVPTQDDYFYASTLTRFASVMVERDESPYGTFSDFQAMILGAAMTDMDARELLSGNFSFEDRNNSTRPATSDTTYYTNFASVGPTVFKSRLVRKTPQWGPNSGLAADDANIAGLLTTRAWAQSHMEAGTNRRALEHTFKIFLCAPIESWKSTDINEMRIRRDVDRAPGGNPVTFQTLCRGCHAPMDGMGGAFARYDFVGGRLTWSGPNRIPGKMNNNPDTFPDGYITIDESWINLLADPAHDTGRFGWRGDTSGMGLKSFGQMIANSQEFKRCMTKRVYREVCKRDTGANDTATVQEIADRFETSGYKLRNLFADVAVNSGCLNQ